MPLTNPDETGAGRAAGSSAMEPASLEPQPPVVDLDHPWLGLESFREETRAYFFGRDAEIAEIHLRLRSGPLLVLYGRSGLGKTSILNAGLIPRLRADGQRPQVERLDYKKDAPGPVEQLFFALFGSDQGSLMTPGLKRTERISAWETQLNAALALPTSEEPARRLSRLNAMPQDAPSRLWLRLHWRKETPEITHLILDQFEEIFTLGAQRPGSENEMRDALAILLQGAIPEPISRLIAEHDAFLDHFDPDSTPVRVVLALRDDYVYALNRWKRHLPALGQNTFELRALRGPAAFDAVFKPGELRCQDRGEVKEENRAETGLPPIVSEETARRIVRFVARKKEDVPLVEIEAVPPILSLLCRELNLRRFPTPPGAAAPPEAQITFREGDADVETIIATFYERCLDGRPEAVRIFIEEELVSYSGARLPQDEQSILKLFVEGCDVPGAADERRAAGYGDLPAARACLQDLVNQRLLTSRGDGENPSYELIHDLLATVVEKSRTAREERFEKEQADRRARAARDAKETAETQARTTRKRAIVTTAIVSIAFLIAAIAAWFGFRKAAEAEKQAKEALRQTKVAETANGRNLQLLHNASMADYAAAVQRIEQDGRWREGVAHLSRALEWEPANALAAGRLYSTVALYAPEKAGLPRALLSHDGAVLSASFSPDGSKVITASDDNTARLWDVGVILQPTLPAPTWVRDWARAVAGYQFNADGVMQPLTATQRISVLATPHEGNDPWSRLARWVAMKPEDRTIHPDSSLTVRSIAERERDFGSEESLQSALRYDPTVPLARLLLAEFEQNPARSAFLREYDLKRLPDDAVLWTRATKALSDQGDKTRALQALEKLAKIAPDQAGSLKTQLNL